MPLYISYDYYYYYWKGDGIVFYGYTLLRWNEQERNNLMKQLSKELNIPIGRTNNDGISPYIEQEGGHVNIRRITHLPHDKERELIKKADKVYNEYKKIVEQ